MTLEAVNPDVVNESAMAAGQETSVKFYSRDGGKSVSRMRAQGEFCAELETPLDIGRSNEPRVIDALVGHLTKSGREAEWIPSEAGDDSSGTDGRIRVEAGVVYIQIVTVPVPTALWRELTRVGVKQIVGDVDDAVAWLREGIEKKRTRSQPNTWLLLDASKISALARQDVVEAYRRRHGDAAEECGWGAVWIVGPSSGTTLRLSV